MALSFGGPYEPGSDHLNEHPTLRWSQDLLLFLRMRSSNVPNVSPIIVGMSIRFFR